MLVVPTEDEVPAKLQPLREYNGDKMVVVLDPEAGSLALELGLPAGARARADEALGRRGRSTRGAVRATVERALAALEEERKVKQQLTGAKTEHRQGLRPASRAMAGARARALAEIDALVRPARRGRAALPDDQLSSRAAAASLFESWRSLPM